MLITSYDDFIKTRLINIVKYCHFCHRQVTIFMVSHKNTLSKVSSAHFGIKSTRFGKMHFMGKEEGSSSVITLQHHCYVTAE